MTAVFNSPHKLAQLRERGASLLRICPCASLRGTLSSGVTTVGVNYIASVVRPCKTNGETRFFTFSTPINSPQNILVCTRRDATGLPSRLHVVENCERCAEHSMRSPIPDNWTLDIDTSGTLCSSVHVSARCSILSSATPDTSQVAGGDDPSR